MSMGSWLSGSGTCPNASRIEAITLIMSSLAACRWEGCGPGLSTHRMTNKPIMHMMRSASVKIHSGHSSQISWGSHFLQDAAMEEEIHHRDTESTETKSTGSALLDRAMRQATNTVFESLDVKIDEQSELPVSQSQVGQELCFMDGINLCNAFRLNDDLLHDQQI